MNETSTTRLKSHSPARYRRQSTASQLPRVIPRGLERWLSARHALPIEAAAALMLYSLYELARGLVVGDVGKADDHARDVVAIERWLHLFDELDVRHAANAVPGLATVLGTTGAGHGVDRADWKTITRAILEHTAKGDGETT
jgi:hypothetical protein